MPEGFDDIEFEEIESDEWVEEPERGPSAPAPPPPPEGMEEPAHAAAADEATPQRARRPAEKRRAEAPFPEGEEETVEPPAEGEPERPAREKHAPRKPSRSRGAPHGGMPVALQVAIYVGAAVVLGLTIGFTRLGAIDYSNLVFFLIIFTLAAHLEMKLRGGGTLNLGIAPLFAALIALPISLPKVPYSSISAAGCVQVIWMFLLGTAVTVVTLMIGRLNKERVLALLIDFIAVGVASFSFFLLVKLLPKKPLLHGQYTPSVLVAAAVAAGLFYLFYVGRESFVLSADGQFPTAVFFQSVLRRSWLAYCILVFTGGFLGLVFVGIGMWSMLVPLPLLLFAMYAYNKIAASDQYLFETIRVLSAIPEETGMLERGHAVQVAELAAGVAQELGLSPEDAQQVEFAAYLHDIGVITRGPAREEQRELTETEGVISGGVDIVGKVPYLEVAAEILGGREGLRDRVTDLDKRRAVSLGAGILRAVDDFQSLLEGTPDREPLSEGEALTEMNLERGVKYDSKVLRAISRATTRMPRELATGAEGSAESSPFWGDEES